MLPTAYCLACTAGITEEEYCKLHPETVGCAPGILLSILKMKKCFRSLNVLGLLLSYNSTQFISFKNVPLHVHKCLILSVDPMVKHTRTSVH